MLLVSFTFKCKITPAQIPLIPFSAMHSINPTAAAAEPWPDPLSSAETRAGMERTGKWQIQSTLEAAEPALHRNSFLSLALLSFNSNGFRKKATLPQLLLSQHLFWQAIIRAIEVFLSLFILLKCYNRSNNTFTFTLFFLSIKFKIL